MSDVSPILLEVNGDEISRMEWSMSTEEVLGATGKARLIVQDMDLSWEPEAHWDVKVSVRSSGWVLFRGEIVTTPITLITGADFRVWQLECSDYNNQLPQRLVGAFDGKTWIDDSGLGIYVNIDPNAETLETDKLTVQNLFDVYLRVADGTAIDTTTYVNEYLTDFYPISWAYGNLQRSLEELAALINVNLQFWIDPDLKFHWVAIPAWQDVATDLATGSGPTLDMMFPEGSLGGLPVSSVVASDIRAETGQIGFSKLSLTPDGSDMPEQLYVQGGTGYVYNAPPIPPLEETKTVVKSPIAGAQQIYHLTFLSSTKIWHTDGTGFISLTFGTASAGGPYNAKYVSVPWNAARNKGGHFWKLLSGPDSGKLVDNDTNVLGYGSIKVVAITTAPGTPEDPKIGIGGSGWVGEVDQDPNKRQAYLQAPMSTTKSMRDSFGGQALYRGSRPTLRGSLDCYGIDGWRVGMLLKIEDNRLPSYADGRFFVIQRVRAALLPGNDKRKYTLDFGDGPVSRYSAQRRGGDAGWPPPAIKIDISVHDLAPGPSSSQIITGQLVNGSGEAWALRGKTVNWSFECYNSAGVLQTGQGSINPEVSVTDKNGRARITFTSGPGLGLVYYIFADVIAT